MFTSNTARMQAARVAELQELSADDAIPSEMIGGETTRIDQTALTNLIEKSEGIAVGTPKAGLPQLDTADPGFDDVTVVRMARGSSQELDVDAPPEPAAAPVVAAPPKTSRLRDLLIGAAISIAAMAAWYAATQL